MKVRYLGPHDEGFVPFQGQEFLVVRDEESEVPDELGALLCRNAEQYEAVSKAKRSAAATPGDES